MIKRGIDNLRKYGSANPLSKNILLYSFGSLGSRAINFAIYPILTFYLLKGELGFYDVVVNTIFLVVPLTTLQYADGIYRAILTLDDELKKKNIIGRGFNFIATTSFVLLVLIVSILSWSTTMQFEWLIFLMAFFFGINQSLKQIVRGLKKNVQYVTGDILYSLVFILCLLLTLTAGDMGLQGVFISFIAAAVVSTLYLIFSSGVFRYLDLKAMPVKGELKPILRYSTPLIPNTISWWLVGSANAYIITLILGLDFNGLYAVAYKVSSIIYILSRVFNLAWQDQLIANEKEDPRYSSRIFNNLATTLLLITIILVLLMKPLLRLVVEDAYFIVWQYVPFLLLAAVLSSISAYFGAFYLKWQKTDNIFLSTVLGAIAAIVASVVLTFTMGLLGTSISMMIGFGTVALYRYLDTRGTIQLKLNRYIPILFLALIAAIIILFQL